MMREQLYRQRSAMNNGGRASYALKRNADMLWTVWRNNVPLQHIEPTPNKPEARIAALKEADRLGEIALFDGE